MNAVKIKSIRGEEVKSGSKKRPVVSWSLKSLLALLTQFVAVGGDFV
ncbi:hypothetical protein HYS82_01005 [Candidatus Amesbacteria bacterium]|nr:hypothetical protein [Candidatus Amesbacteria bacterium]MBI2587509.1 hypothetical protein [Candidatus Amesbacteria bacterium]